METLIEILRLLDDFERSRISSITIEPGTGGYHAEISVNAYLPSPEESGIEGVERSGVDRYPRIEHMLDWRVPIWDQIVQVVRDKDLSAPGKLGTMYADEHSKVYQDGHVADHEGAKFWVIATHGRPRSAERNEWYKRCSEGRPDAHV